MAPPYPAQLQFFATGKHFRERALFAGNQVGKSTALSYEAGIHLTGLYPEGWEGRRWDRPIRSWVVGESSKVVRDIVQRKLLGEPGSEQHFGAGMIPRHLIITDSIVMQHGEKHAIDTMHVRHVSGGSSTLKFRAFNQGRSTLQGESLDRVEKAFEEMGAARAGFAALCQPGGWNDRAPIFLLGLSRRRLLVFIELIEQRQLATVADNLGISQPAVSQALRDVERGLGVVLVSRTAAGIMPNTLGEPLSMHTRRALAEIRSAEAEVASLQSGVSGHVVVGTLSLGRNWLLPRAVVSLTRTYPNLTVSTVDGTFEHLAVLLRAGDVDFIVGGLRPPEHTIGLISDVVVEDTLGVIVRSNHPLTQRPEIDFADLEHVRWVLPQRGPSTRSTLEASLRSRNLREPRVIVETADIAITRGLLMESDLVTATSLHLFQHEIDAAALSVLPLAPPGSRRGIGILQRSDSKPSIAAQLLMDGIRAVARS